MKRVFAIISSGRYLEVKEGHVIEQDQGDVTVRLDNGEVETLTLEDIFETREAAESEAARWDKERDQVWQEAREDAAQVYYKDVLSQCLA